MTRQYRPDSLREELETYGPEPTIRVVMMPKHTNALGSIFGGVILSQVDLAAGEEARKTAQTRVVTKVMREVEFGRRPAFPERDRHIERRDIPRDLLRRRAVVLGYFDCLFVPKHRRQ
ncbi:MAG: hypothetical protein ABEL76_13020, partial [Bradymonadaceae bacterium]